MRATLMAFCLLTSFTAVAADEKPIDAFAPLAFLVGSCWQAAMPDGKAIDTHCYEWVYGGKYIRNVHTVEGWPTPYGGETIFYYDHDAKVVRYLYFANDGGTSSGIMVPKDGKPTYPEERYVGPEGVMNLRNATLHADGDSYSTRTEVQSPDGQWKEMFTLNFKRKP